MEEINIYVICACDSYEVCMKDLKRVSARICEAMTYKGITNKELAERIGVDVSTLSRKQHSPEKYTLEELNRIERVLKVQILEVQHEGN